MTLHVIELSTVPDDMFYQPRIFDWFKLHPVSKAAEQLILTYDQYHLCSSLTSRLQITERLLDNLPNAYK